MIIKKFDTDSDICFSHTLRDVMQFCYSLVGDLKDYRFFLHVADDELAILIALNKNNIDETNTAVAILQAIGDWDEIEVKDRIDADA